MKALDTNVLVRFLMADDEKQTASVYELFKKSEKNKQELFITILVILELLWVLESVYEINRQNIVNSLSDMMQMPIFKFEHHLSLQQLVIAAKDTNTDLSDLLIAQCAKSLGCKVTLTFDKKAAKTQLFKLMGEK
ncbi:MAG: type II toxin-antitoxin system VapC family toxin [Proteobacteria bacterium]|nr:type II toxin-antitoxin system VapC family toxin [Pseudomonadota bacterium]